MTIAALSMIHRVADALQDPTAIRWTTAELVRYLNDGVRETVIYRPDAANTTATLVLVAGTRQALPATHAKLIDVLYNTASKLAVRMTTREILDAQTPSWRAISGTVDVKHFIYDPRQPKVFDVYPPATSASSIEAIVAVFPTDIAEPAAATIWSDVVGNFGLPDIFANAVQDYVLFRAYSKDAEYAGNEAKAAGHYAAFANALGIEIKATVMVGPQGTGSDSITKQAG
jgi:hypothetical protein